jgi:hypothetical protein
LGILDVMAFDEPLQLAERPADSPVAGADLEKLPRLLRQDRIHVGGHETG